MATLDRNLPRLRSLLMVAVLAGFVASLASPSQAQRINWGSSATRTTDCAIDQKVCKVSDQELACWIKKTTVFTQLNQAITDTIDAIPNLKAKEFHHKSSAGDHWRTKAQGEVKAVQTTLRGVATSIIRRLKSSCDVCFLAKDWTELYEAVVDLRGQFKTKLSNISQL